MSKMVDYDGNSSTESDSDDSQNSKVVSNNSLNAYARRNRQPKSFSRNALMARENRLKKKVYIENLEKDVFKEKSKNRKLHKLLAEQANIITNLEKKVKYMKSVLANSEDISRLLKTIHSSTGMPVATSINKNLILSDESEPKTSEHPWFESLQFDECLPSEFLSESEPHSCASTDEHNYTLPSDPEEDVGVCLHISKHKVALEFCNTCNDNAHDTWSAKNC